MGTTGESRTRNPTLKRVVILFAIVLVAIAGTLFSWRRTRDEILVTKITTDPNNQYHPVIEGDLIVWTDDRDGNLEIYCYDLATNQEKRITSEPHRQDSPTVLDGKILWWDYREGAPVPYMYDPATGQQRPAPEELARRVWSASSPSGPPTSAQTKLSPASRARLRPRPLGASYEYGDFTLTVAIWSDFDVIQAKKRSQAKPWTLTTTAQVGPVFIHNYCLAWVENPGFSLPARLQKRWKGAALEMRYADLRTSKMWHVDYVPVYCSSPITWNNRIVWSDERNGNADVFLATLTGIR